MAGVSAPFEINVEWSNSTGVTTPELSATWARLSIAVDDRWVTLVERNGGSVGKAIYVTAYPLAEWLAFNWWLIDSDYRPARLSPAMRHSRLRSHASGWQFHHRLALIGEGMSWPDLALVPIDQEAIELTWQARDCESLRFLTSGQSVIDKKLAQAALSGFIESVVERLDEEGVIDTPLQSEWSAIIALDEAEVDFCRASASLGLDPFMVSDSVAELIDLASNALGPGLFEDFLVATTETTMKVDLDWTKRAIDELAPRSGSYMARPPAKIDPTSPWLEGYQDARRLRGLFDLAPTAPILLDELASVQVVHGGSGHVRAVGTTTSEGSAALAVPAPIGRFSTARGIFRARQSNDPFLLARHGGMSIQKAERAFAAELLAPSAGLRQLLQPEEGEDAWVDNDRVTELARHFDVSLSVIGHQLQNHFAIETEGLVV